MLHGERQLHRESMYVTMGAGLHTISVNYDMFYKKIYKARACCTVMQLIDKYGQRRQSVFTILQLLLPQNFASVAISAVSFTAC